MKRMTGQMVLTTTDWFGAVSMTILSAILVERKSLVRHWLTIQRGQTVEIVGRTGAERLPWFDNSCGSVPRLVRESFWSTSNRSWLQPTEEKNWLCFPRTYLLSKSIRENIALGKRSQPRWLGVEAVACKLLFVDLSGCLRGMDTLIGEKGVSVYQERSKNNGSLCVPS